MDKNPVLIKMQDDAGNCLVPGQSVFDPHLFSVNKIQKNLGTTMAVNRNHLGRGVGMN